MKTINFLSGFVALVLIALTAYWSYETYQKIDSVGHAENTNQSKKIPPLSIMPVGESPRIGEDTARVQMIVFVDYQCPFCEQFVSTQLPVLIEEYVNNGSLQITFKNLPLSRIHSLSNTLAVISHLRYREGNFERFLSEVYSLQRTVQDSTKVFETFGISRDNAQIPGIQNFIDESVLHAKIAGITATPTFIINNRVLSGLRSIDEIKSLIDYSMENVIKTPNSGAACGE